MISQDIALRREAIWRWVERLYGWPPAAWESGTDFEGGENDIDPFGGEAVVRMRHPLYKIELHIFPTPVWGDYVARMVQFASDRGFPVSGYLPSLDGNRLIRWKDRVLAACRSWEGPSPPPVSGKIRQLFAYAAWWHRVARGATPALPRQVDPLPGRLARDWRSFIDRTPEGQRQVVEKLFAAWRSWAAKWDLPERWNRAAAAGGSVGAFERVDHWVDGGEGTWWLRRANRCRPGAAFEDVAALLLRYGGRMVDPRRWENWLNGYQQMVPFPDDQKLGVALMLWSPHGRQDEGWAETARRWVRRARELADLGDWFGTGDNTRREWRDWANRLQDAFSSDPVLAKPLTEPDVVNATERISGGRPPVVRLALRPASGRRATGAGRQGKKRRIDRDPWLSDADPSLSPAGEHRHEHHEQHH